MSVFGVTRTPGRVDELEAVMLRALEAAQRDFRDLLQCDDVTVVINVAWNQGAGLGERSIGSAIPEHHRELLGDSLRQSAAEADDTYIGDSEQKGEN